MSWVRSGGFTLSTQIKIGALETLVAETPDRTLATVAGHSEVNVSLTVSILGRGRSGGVRSGTVSILGLGRSGAVRLGPATTCLDEEPERFTILTFTVHQGGNQLVVAGDGDLISLLIYKTGDIQ